jgi:hypothetical protein
VRALSLYAVCVCRSSYRARAKRDVFILSDVSADACSLQSESDRDDEDGGGKFKYHASEVKMKMNSLSRWSSLRV